jgi:5-methylthioadenosine/S-adenosylhomocysteine deaminase
VRPIERLRRLGLLSPALIAVHAVHLERGRNRTAGAARLFRRPLSQFQSQACQRHCPDHAAVASGVNIGLGTDGAASNNRLDLFQEMRLAALLAKQQAGRADAINAHRCCTWRPLAELARSVSRRASARSPRARRPTSVCRQLNDIALAPCYDPVSHLAYAVGREHVSAVWVAAGCGSKTGN